MEIQYQTVLDNVARFICHPGMLPSHARLEEGTVQVSNEAGINGLRVSWGDSPGSPAVRSRCNSSPSNKAPTP